MRWSADGSSGFARADRSRIGDEERRGEKPSVVSCNVTVNFGRARGVGSCGSRGVDRKREREWGKEKERERGNAQTASQRGGSGARGVTGRMSGSPSPAIPRYLRRGPPRPARGHIARLHNKSWICIYSMLQARHGVCAFAIHRIYCIRPSTMITYLYNCSLCQIFVTSEYFRRERVSTNNYD